MTNQESIERIQSIKSKVSLYDDVVALRMAEEALENRKKGHWITKIKSDLRGDMWPANPKCSECGGEPYYSNTIYSYKFCPYCGADMRGE